MRNRGVTLIWSPEITWFDFERAFGKSHEPGRGFPDRDRNWGLHKFTLYIHVCWQKYQPCKLPICILHKQRDICVVVLVNRSFEPISIVLLGREPGSK